MVHPLVGNDQWAFRLCQMGNGILSQYSNMIGVDKLWNTVIDLTVHVIRTASKDNAMRMSLLHPFQSFLTLLAYVKTCLAQFFPGSFCSFCDLSGSHTFLAIEFFNQAVGHDLQTFKA